MGDPIQPDEPVIVYTVRGLLRELRDDITRQFEEFGKKLDDRATVGMFRALQSELAAKESRIVDLERVVDDLKEWRTGQDASDNTRAKISARFLAWSALIVALLTAIATLLWLWIGGS